MGAITWGAAYRLAGAFVNPATGFNRSVTFLHRSGVWYETSRTAADAGN